MNKNEIIKKSIRFLKNNDCWKQYCYDYKNHPNHHNSHNMINDMENAIEHMGIRWLHSTKMGFDWIRSKKGSKYYETIANKMENHLIMPK